MDKVKKVPVNTQTRDPCNLAAPTGNIYETVVILSKRANQISLAEKKELTKNYWKKTEAMQHCIIKGRKGKTT